MSTAGVTILAENLSDSLPTTIIRGREQALERMFCVCQMLFFSSSLNWVKVSIQTWKLTELRFTVFLEGIKPMRVIRRAVSFLHAK